MPYYIQNPISLTTCIGDSLTTFNSNFTALDTNLYNLSTFSYNGINYLSATMVSVSSTFTNQINYLSATMVSVSGELNTEINTASSYVYNKLLELSSYTYSADNVLFSQINYMSANFIKDHIKQGILLCPSDGQTVNWDTTAIGVNAMLVLSANVHMANPTNLYEGKSGNLLTAISTAGKAITSYGDAWTFVGSVSSGYTSFSARNLISYYYDGFYLRSTITKYNI